MMGVMDQLEAKKPNSKLDNSKDFAMTRSIALATILSRGFHFYTLSVEAWPGKSWHWCWWKPDFISGGGGLCLLSKGVLFMKWCGLGKRGAYSPVQQKEGEDGGEVFRGGVRREVEHKQDQDAACGWN